MAEPAAPAAGAGVGDGAASAARGAELAARWDALARRVAEAAEAAGRSAADLTVIAVTKTWPYSDIVCLRDIGVRDIGENRAQELAAKLQQAAIDTTHRAPELRWHFIGQLQRNKAGLIARTCTALHTVDRVELIAPLARAAEAADRRLDVFLQLSLDGDPKRGGATEAELATLADQVEATDSLRLRGLMAVPPLGEAPRPAFARLRAVSEGLRRTHPAASALSAGMSGDLEEAVMEGATHLRVGTGLMGSRA